MHAIWVNYKKWLAEKALRGLGPFDDWVDCEIDYPSEEQRWHCECEVCHRIFMAPFFIPVCRACSSRVPLQQTKADYAVGPADTVPFTPTLKSEESPMIDEIEANFLKQANGATLGHAPQGGAKGLKKERYDLVPPTAMDQVARVYGYGATKYADNQYRAGYPYGWSIAALERHLSAFKKGEDIDPESGESHLAHVAWHCLTLMTFQNEGTGTDDRHKV